MESILAQWQVSIRESTEKSPIPQLVQSEGPLQSWNTQLVMLLPRGSSSRVAMTGGETEGRAMGALSGSRAHAQNNLWLRRVAAGHDESASKTLVSLMFLSNPPLFSLTHYDVVYA